jgi:SAM-dependent methyltransferase
MTAPSLDFPARAGFTDDGAVREQLTPRPGDIDYFILSDLVAWLRSRGAEVTGCVLDFGCGDSPYRTLLSQEVSYRRADLSGAEAEGLDFEVDGEGHLNAPDESFDAVLSTQVAEHVGDPHLYFREAWRTLKPGGRLLLTTHGVWADHAVPTDYQRWTAEGLVRDLQGAGFERVQYTKFTTEWRAVAQLVSRFLSTRMESRTLAAGCWRRFWRRARPLAHRLIDGRTSRQALGQAHDRFYLGLAMLAWKGELDSTVKEPADQTQQG